TLPFLDPAPHKGGAQALSPALFLVWSLSLLFITVLNWRKEPPGVGGKRKSLRGDPPAAVASVEILKRVGQSGLMISWERPPLDELGCSNGTFVSGY
ncbi:hypothetical protein Z043_115046, partial [Scleropages formosus]